MREVARTHGCSLPLCPYFLGISEDQDGMSARKFSSSRSESKRVRQCETRCVWTQRAYQIETTRTRIAIEFFFIAGITFLSSRRCKRGPFAWSAPRIK
jgi:hypothetical protein